MPSTISNGYGDPLHITNGLLAKRRYVSVSRTIILQNIVRLLQENQATELDKQTTLDNWLTNPLEVIPASRFHIGTGLDFNDLSCSLIYTGKNSDANSGTNRQLDISLLVTVEGGTDSADCFRRADSYITAFEGILDTFFNYSPNELRYDIVNSTSEKSVFYNIGIVKAEITGVGLVNTANLLGIQRAIGFLPALAISVIYSPTAT